MDLIYGVKSLDKWSINFSWSPLNPTIKWDPSTPEDDPYNNWI